MATGHDADSTLLLIATGRGLTCSAQVYVILMLPPLCIKVIAAGHLMLVKRDCDEADSALDPTDVRTRKTSKKQRTSVP